MPSKAWQPRSFDWVRLDPDEKTSLTFTQAKNFKNEDDLYLIIPEIDLPPIYTQTC